MPNTTTTNEFTRSPIDGTEFIRLATTGTPGNNYKAQLKAVTSTLTVPGYGHRLTPTSGTPFIISSAKAKSTVYYTPYIHNRTTIYDGANWVSYFMPEDSITLDATNFLSGKLYDVFVALNAGTPNIGYGPAWSSLTSRGSGAGTTELVRKDGIWTNANTITLRRASGTTFSASVNQASYVGTMYGTANGQTGMDLGGSTFGGNASTLGIYNAYNPVAITTWSEDTTNTWVYTSSPVWRPANNSTNNNVSWVDGLGTVAFFGNDSVGIASSGFTGEIAMGLSLNNSGASPIFVGVTAVTGPASGETITATALYPPTLGFNTVYAMEWSNNPGCFFVGGGGQWIEAVCFL